MALFATGMLQCLDSVSDFHFYGNLNTERGSVVQAMITRCEGPHCKTEDEIDTFVRDHRIILIRNQQDY